MWLSDLSPEWVHLVRAMQRIGFGCIRNLTIRNGQPVINPQLRLVRDVKVGEPKPAALPRDYVLKREVVNLHAELSGLREAHILTLEVRNGLPFRYSLEEYAA